MLERNLIQVTEARRSYPKMHGITLAGSKRFQKQSRAAVTTHTAQRAKPLLNDSKHPAVSEAVREQCDIEADKLDSELSMVRYISWAIPSIGFIGTVRTVTLGQAYKVAEGDISGVTVSLGVAFNSTFVALVLSIVIMLALHQLQLSQERLVLSTQRYVDKKLIRHLAALK